MEKIKLGVWVAYDMDAIVMNMDTDLPWFSSKKEAVEQVRFTSMDPRKTPKLIRLSAGKYLYRPKDVDCPSRFGGKEICIEMVSEENQSSIQELFDEIAARDPLCDEDS